MKHIYKLIITQPENKGFIIGEYSDFMDAFDALTAFNRSTYARESGQRVSMYGNDERGLYYIGG